ncbi:carboxymuconolactone decarboxylase family protein [Streptomyces sp. NRRL S-646]|uniref:carboxymuconolactone decarboxylase family protein n=1 Tax=Streptomyces sp. NRRL S-646 TaxID=1463917 RepID=UPI000690FBF4|nr:carboxymuconolactone decarboxylase family protein [Streptomyces sp. NRRL S-646]
MTGRLPALVPGDPETRRLLDPYRLPDGRPLPVFQAVAHSRAALDDLRRATAACLKGTLLDARVREVTILRVCARAGAEAEWAVHVEMFAAEADLSEAEVLATATRDAPVLRSVRDALAVRLADEIHDTSTVSEDLWTALATTYTPQEIVELLLVVTQYHKVACLTNALALRAPAGLPTLPRDID